MKVSNKITISGCSTTVFQAWIKYVYGLPIAFEQNRDIAEELVVFSESYGPVGLKEDYFEYLSNNFTVADALNFLESALKKKSIAFECRMMLRKCLEIIEPVAYDHLKNANLLYLDESLLFDFLSSMKLAADEFELFNFLLKWGEEAVKRKVYPNLVEAVKPFIGFIRFPQMTLDELNGAVQKSGIVPYDILQNALRFTQSDNGEYFEIGRDLLAFKETSNFEAQYISRNSIIFGSLLTPKQYQILLKWVRSKYPSFTAPQKLKMIYNANRNGWKASDFHKYCDNKGPTIVVCKVSNGNIFGGFAANDWLSNSQYGNNPDCFMFSLVNNSGIPQTFSIITSNKNFATYSYSTYGPTFGGGFDLYICSEANKYNSSYSNLGHTYNPPVGASYGSTKAKNFLAGSYNFILTDLEVFTLNPPPKHK